MNLVWRLLTPLLINLARRFGPRLTGVDAEQFNRSKRRLGAALLLLFTSLVLFITGLLLTMIDLAVQFEQHGSIEFTTILVISLGLMATGFVSLIGAKMTMPAVRDFVSFGPGAKPTKGAKNVAVEQVPRPPRRPEYAH